MRTVALLALLWGGFMATHLLLSSARLRPALVARLGVQRFFGLYSLVAVALFVPLVGVYFADRHAGPLLWTTLGPPVAARWANHVVMAIALALVVAAFLPGSAPPSALGARRPVAVRGMLRITLHPLLAGLALFGIAHLLVNGSLGDVVFFGGFPVFAWIGARHQDARKVGEVPGYAALVAETSFVPFAAVATGRQRLAARDFAWGAVAAGLALTVLLRWYHPVLFGP